MLQIRSLLQHGCTTSGVTTDTHHRQTTMTRRINKNKNKNYMYRVFDSTKTLLQNAVFTINIHLQIYTTLINNTMRGKLRSHIL